MFETWHNRGRGLGYYSDFADYWGDNYMWDESFLSYYFPDVFTYGMQSQGYDPSAWTPSTDVWAPDPSTIGPGSWFQEPDVLPVFDDWSSWDDFWSNPALYGQGGGDPIQWPGGSLPNIDPVLPDDLWIDGQKYTLDPATGTYLPVDLTITTNEPSYASGGNFPIGDNIPGPAEPWPYPSWGGGSATGGGGDSAQPAQYPPCDGIWAGVLVDGKPKLICQPRPAGGGAANNQNRPSGSGGSTGQAKPPGAQPQQQQCPRLPDGRYQVRDPQTGQCRPLQPGEKPPAQAQDSSLIWLIVGGVVLVATMGRRKG
jgi:hypothetical protein